MSSVCSIAAQQVALTQAQVKTEIAARLLKTAQETGARQALELVRQAAESVAQTAAASARLPGRLDLVA